MKDNEDLKAPPSSRTKRERKEPATLNIDAYLLTATEENAGKRTIMLPKNRTPMFKIKAETSNP
jgi:hypothetical protein